MDPRVVFIPASEQPPFAESDYYDLIHTNRRGAAKVTREMIRGLRETL